MTDKNDFGRIVFEHNGALGDMLAAWPAAFSLCAHFRTVSHFFRTRPGHAPFFAALGAAPCPPLLCRELDALYGAPRWPGSLADTLVVRPGLFRRPDIPDDPRFLFLSGVVPGRFDPPSALYREALAARGIPWRDDWLAVFRDRFGGRTPSAGMGKPGPPAVLLFPGAGHVKKTWPMDNFLRLAGMLAKSGLEPIFVLGPAEVERGVDVGPWPRRVPDSLEELMALLRPAWAVLGADCGPMHLAGLLGVPGVSVFGPTSPRQWAPEGMAVVTADMPCSPCVQVTSGDFAPGCPVSPPCLTGVSVERVHEALKKSGLPPRTPPGENHFPRTP
ncbi:glycosyltransferase family 9 protein [Desulfovibrio sulfodismutans]|uniref:Glycosyltransferase family 9 protein n=1 Tax=Desulfolutivibrio sulfodismutans TaxID=63561 RepID=A0A7K3NM13_9BACT|nr:glycosyltransferase family 9 protein [Desulfolutivibrio sulfodismutans]NDY57147.1 glycosyltransferase family 9 protein [Desulfolutivibrio sulfodismutans]QLA11074.1 glycosyl transferase [Desulfolutivibrio sulfodismutans DSM 3696]